MAELENFFQINLPSRCLAYPGVKTENVKIRAYIGKDEIYLSEINPTNLEQKYLSVLQTILQGVNPEDITLGDLMYIIVWEYAKSYNNMIQVNTICSHCMKEVTVPVDLALLNKVELPADFKQPYKLDLPSGESINVRLLTIKDEIEAQKYEAGHGNSLYRIAKSIVSELDVLQRMEKLSSMSAKDVATIRAFHEKCYHGPDMNSKFTCPRKECGREDTVEVPFRFDYLYPRGSALTNSLGKRV